MNQASSGSGSNLLQEGSGQPLSRVDSGYFIVNLVLTALNGWDYCGQIATWSIDNMNTTGLDFNSKCWPGALTSLKGSTLPGVTAQKFWDGFEVANMSSISEKVCGHLMCVAGIASFLSLVDLKGWHVRSMGAVGGRRSCSPAEC